MPFGFQRLEPRTVWALPKGPLHGLLKKAGDFPQCPKSPPLGLKPTLVLMALMPGLNSVPAYQSRHTAGGPALRDEPADRLTSFRTRRCRGGLRRRGLRRGYLCPLSL